MVRSELKRPPVLTSVNNPQPSTALPTLCAPPTAPASLSAAALATITATNVSERSVMQTALTDLLAKLFCLFFVPLKAPHKSPTYCGRNVVCFVRPQGDFPALQVFGPLGVSTVVISLLLWFTQRRHVKSLWGRRVTSFQCNDCNPLTHQPYLRNYLYLKAKSVEDTF